MDLGRHLSTYYFSIFPLESISSIKSIREVLISEDDAPPALFDPKLIFKLDFSFNLAQLHISTGFPVRGGMVREPLFRYYVSPRLVLLNGDFYDISVMNLKFI